MSTPTQLRAVTRHKRTDDEAAELDLSYPQKFLDCRDERHHWQRLGLYHANGEIVVVRICQRCDMEARDFWSPNGFRNRPRRYVQPEGYKLGGDVDMHDVREQVLKRATVYQSEAAMHGALLKPGRKTTKAPAAKVPPLSAPKRKAG